MKSFEQAREVYQRARKHYEQTKERIEVLRESLRPKLRAADRLDARIKVASETKPEVLKRSRELAKPLVNILGELSARGEILPHNQDDRERTRRLEAGSWVLDSIENPDGETKHFKLTDQETTLKINCAGDAVLLLSDKTANERGLSGENLSPEFVASVVDSEEFGLQPHSSSLVYSKNGRHEVAAPLAGHSEAVQQFIGSLVLNVSEQSAQTPETRQYSPAGQV